MQEKVDCWIKENTKGYWDPPSMVLRLAEEVGELAREVNHKYGQKPRKTNESAKGIKDITGEVADVYFALICIANACKIDLDQELEQVLKKYSRRVKPATANTSVLTDALTAPR